MFFGLTLIRMSGMIMENQVEMLFVCNVLAWNLLYVNIFINKIIESTASNPNVLLL